MRKTLSNSAINASTASWDARLRGARATGRDREEFEVWLAESPEHQIAHDRLQTALAALRDNVKLPELSALRDEARQGVHQSRRRRMSTGLATAVAAALVVFVGVELKTGRGTEIVALIEGGTVYHTGLDERTKVALGDGSVVTMDADTRLVVRFSRTRRDVTLQTGRALFHVAKNPHRPFVVRAGDDTITALGTIFDVGLSSGDLRVTLAEGAVAVRNLQPGRTSAPEIMRPHQQFVQIAGSASSELRTVDLDKVLSWVKGRVFFEDEALVSAVEEMNKYTRIKIIVDPAVAGLKINGMFRTNNQIGFVGALQTTLPVNVHSDDRGAIIVSKRPEIGSSTSVAGDESE